MFEDSLTLESLTQDYVVLKLTKAEIARKHGCTAITIGNHLKRHGIENHSRFVNRTEDLSCNPPYGRLKAIEWIGTDKHKKSSWKCQCSCGKTVTVAAASLLRGLTTSCGCYKKSMAHKGFMDISASFWRRKTEEAAKRGLDFLITQEYVWSVFESQERKCIYTGLQLEFCSDSNKPHSQTASIDRIDSWDGYVEGNIQIVHKVVNLCRNWLPDEEFVAMCNLVSENRGMNHEDCVNQMSRTVYRKTRHRSGG